MSHKEAFVPGRKRKVRWWALSLALAFVVLPGLGLAAEGGHLSFTDHWIGYLCVALFVFAYALVIGEEALHLRKSKPVIVAAGRNEGVSEWLTRARMPKGGWR